MTAVKEAKIQTLRHEEQEAVARYKKAQKGLENSIEDETWAALKNLSEILLKMKKGDNTMIEDGDTTEGPLEDLKAGAKELLVEESDISS